MSDFTGVRFGYVPHSDDLRAPADRRRFPFWCRHRGIEWQPATPDGRYDVVVVATTADLVRWSHVGAGVGKIAYELIDSYLEIPSTTLQARLRGAVKFASGELSRPVVSYHDLLEAMCRRADAVVCSTEEQRTRLLGLNPSVHPILDAHVDLVGEPKSSFRLGETVNLVWEGLPYTLDDFDTIAPALRDLARERDVALHLVTDLTFRRIARRFGQTRTEDLAKKILPRTYIYEWNDQMLTRIVTACDLALIPLDLTDPLARAKPENKLLIFWRMGMPTITSATPAYERVMGQAGLDLTCHTPADWGDRLRTMLDNEAARREAGATGRRYVEDHHSLERILARWDALFDSLVG